MGGHGNDDGLDLFQYRVVLCTDDRVAVGTILLRSLDPVMSGETALTPSMKDSRLT